MGRPRASVVSALSGLVANGHQVVHRVSDCLSKIPYGGFSPVRLQAGRRRQPSPWRAYMPTQFLRLPLTAAPRGNRRSVSALRRVPSKRTSPEALGSPEEGSRLPCGLSCPAGSSLTTASSAPLSRARRLMVLRPSNLLQNRGSQLLSACPCFRAVGLTPADRAVIGCSNAARDSLRRILNRLGIRASPATQFTPAC